MSGCMELSSRPNHELLLSLLYDQHIAAEDCLNLIEFNFDEVFSSNKEQRQSENYNNWNKPVCIM